MQELKKIGILSTGKILAVIGAIIGLVSGILILIAESVAPAEMSMYLTTLPSYMTGPIGIVAWTVMGALRYFLMGIIGAWLYNVVSSWTGGIKLDISSNKKK